MSQNSNPVNPVTSFDQLQKHLNSQYDYLLATTCSLAAGISRVAFSAWSGRNIKELNLKTIQEILQNNSIFSCAATTFAGSTSDVFARYFLNAFGVSSTALKDFGSIAIGITTIIGSNVLLGRAKILQREQIIPNLVISIVSYSFYKFLSVRHEIIVKQKYDEAKSALNELKEAKKIDNDYLEIDTLKKENDSLKQKLSIAVQNAENANKSTASGHDKQIRQLKKNVDEERRKITELAEKALNDKKEEIIKYKLLEEENNKLKQMLENQQIDQQGKTLNQANETKEEIEKEQIDQQQGETLKT